VAASPAAASGQDGLVHIVIQDIVVQPNITTAVAANLCDIDVNVLAVVDQSGGKTECKALSTALTKAWVVQN